jgi:hypothetical protein
VDRTRELERQGIAQKLASSIRPGYVKRDGTAHRLDRELKTKELAALPLAIDRVGDRLQCVARSVERQAVAVRQNVAARGWPDPEASDRGWR